MTVCCFGRENDHRHRGEQCFCERHTQRHTHTRHTHTHTHTVKESATPLPTGGSFDAGAASSLAKRRRRAVARWWYLVLGRRASSSTSSSQVDLCDKLSSRPLRIGFSKIFSPLLIFHRMFASLRYLHFSFMHVFFSPPSPPPEDAGGKAARLE